VINLGSADYAAHSFGPDSPRYVQTIEYLDALVGELVAGLKAQGVLERTAFILAADHGFSGVDASRRVAPHEDAGGHRLQPLAAQGIEHFVTNTGGTSMGVYVRDKGRVADAAAALRKAPWCEAIYCQDAKAGCDRSLQELHAYYAGRSPDLMVDLDDDTAFEYAQPGGHGSLREADMRIPLVLSGAGIARGRLLGKAALVDVAPTIVRLLGLTPRLLRPDGRALEEALAP